MNKKIFTSVFDRAYLQGFLEYHKVDSSNYKTLPERYSENHRYYHTKEHIGFILFNLSHSDITKDEYIVMQIAALYHDAIYDPTRKDNEEASQNLFLEDVDHMPFLSTEEVDQISKIILSTKYDKIYDDKLCELFRRLDTYHLLECTNAAGYNNLIHNEMMVRKEYQYLDWAKYAEGKKDFCFHFECLDKNYYHGVQITEDLLEAVPPNVYVFAGSFSNFHVGHLSILRECEKECDKVILVVGINPTKPDSIRTLDLRYQNLKELLPFHQVVKWDGLLTDFIREQNKKHPTTLVRGLRSVDDFKVEFSTQRAMEHFYPELQVVYKACPKEYEFVSSSLIKQVQSFGETVEHLLPTTKQIYNLV